MKLISLIEDFYSLLYPRLCMACGNSLFKHERTLCTFCLYDLPKTNFHLISGSPLEKVFWGRIPVNRVAVLYHFSKGGKVQHLIHQLKYKGHKEVGIFTGWILGKDIMQLPEFRTIQTIIPVPLHPKKQKKRGYNQSEQFGIGLAEVTGIKLDTKSFIRTFASETQTRKSRFARYENVKEIFQVVNPEAIANRHILLVDDVITTGSTLEACASILLQVPGVSISIAAIAYAKG